jgi:hypothetical protein
MIWLIGLALIVVLATALFWREVPSDVEAWQLKIDLYAIRRRAEAFQVRHDLRRSGSELRRSLRCEMDAADAQRELQGELGVQDRPRPRHR